MKERPILFSAPMVRAILEGRKTQTRRVIKPQPYFNCAGFLAWKTSGCLQNMGRSAEEMLVMHCQFGAVGDRLWVRESWRCGLAGGENGGFTRLINHRADGNALYVLPECFTKFDEMEEKHGYRGRPSIHMPRWASRITLEISGIRVERLLDIREEDAMAEGAQPSVYSWPAGSSSASAMDCNGLHRNGFRNLWESINGQGSWNANPWVWVIEFKKI